MHRSGDISGDGRKEQTGGGVLEDRARRVPFVDVLHLVREDAGELLRALRGFQEASKDDDVPARSRKRIHLGNVHHIQ